MRQTILALLVILTPVLNVACASKPKGFEMPPALAETFRGGELKGLEKADSPELGMPNQYDRVTHTCTSTPVYNLYGQYVRTSTKCW